MVTPKPITIPGTTTSQPSYMPQPTATHLPAVASHAAMTPFTMQELAALGEPQKLQSQRVADKIASIAKTSDMGEVGKLMTTAIQAAKGYDLDTLQKTGGVGGFFRKVMGKASELSMRFDSVDETVKRLTDQLHSRSQHYRAQVKDLAVMRAENRAQHDALTPIIAAIRERADWMEANVPALDPADHFSGNEINRWKQTIVKARQRADNLDRLQLYFQQLDASIDGMEMNADGLADTMSSLKTESVPAIKMSFVQDIINRDQAGGVQLADMVHNLTQQAIMQAAEKQNRNTIAIATSQARSNIDLDTFKFAHEKIVDGFKQAERIRQDMVTRLANEAPQLQQLSRELTQALAS